MTNEEINRAVAESVGARYFTEDGGGFWIVEMGGKVYEPFTEDLNAMHEAEKTLFRTGYTDMLNQNYWNTVWNVCGDLYCKTTTVAHATARQRAEAYLRTIGKWRDA
jgi:hypothetical protein